MVVSAPEDGLTRNQAARRQRVIEAAMDLAAEGGYDAVQMRDVAARARVALGTIYRYFSSKDHLLAACQLEWSTGIKRRLEQRGARGDTPAERVLEVVQRATRAMERQPLMAKALTTAIASPDPAAAGCQRQVGLIMDEVLQRAIGADVDDDLRASATRVLNSVWFASLLNWVNGRSEIDQINAELSNAARLVLR